MECQSNWHWQLQVEGVTFFMWHKIFEKPTMGEPQQLINMWFITYHLAMEMLRLTNFHECLSIAKYPRAIGNGGLPRYMVWLRCITWFLPRLSGCPQQEQVYSRNLMLFFYWLILKKVQVMYVHEIEKSFWHPIST